jgi:hypothetical protein
MERLIKTYSTKPRPINNNSAVRDKLGCGGAAQEAVFTACLESYQESRYPEDVGNMFLRNACSIYSHTVKVRVDFYDL